MPAPFPLIYVSGADDGTITVLGLDAAAGRLLRHQQVSIGGTGLPMALDARRARLFAVRRNDPASVVTLAIGSDGRLSPVGDGPLPVSCAHVSVDAPGRTLFGASYHQHEVIVARIGPAGLALPVHQRLPGGRHAHCIRVDRSGRWVWSTSLGDDAVLQWRYDEASGTLAPNDPPRVALRTGSGPRHLELHPDGRTAYVIGELDATLALLAIDAEGGRLTPLGHHPFMPPGSEGATPWAADLHLTPDARWLYTSERTTSTVAGFAISADGRSAVPAGHWTVQAQPRAFAITGDGRWMLVAGQSTHRLGLYRIDARTGAIEAADEAPVGRNPAWVEVLDTPPA